MKFKDRGIFLLTGFLLLALVLCLFAPIILYRWFPNSAALFSFSIRFGILLTYYGFIMIILTFSSAIFYILQGFFNKTNKLILASSLIHLVFFLSFILTNLFGIISCYDKGTVCLTTKVIIFNLSLAGMGFIALITGMIQQFFQLKNKKQLIVIS